MRPLPRIAVVDLHGMIMDSGEIIREEPEPWADRHQRAVERGVHQLWYTPGALKVLDLPLKLHPGSLLRAWVSKRIARDRWLSTAVPAWDRNNPFAGCTFGYDLLGSVLEFMSATGMAWRGSGAITSDAWLRERLGKRLRVTEYPQIALEHVEDNLFTRRAPEGGEERAKFCYGFDANAMYLGACSSIALPLGEISRMDNPVVGANLRTPAYYRFADQWYTTPAAEYGGLENGCADEAWWWVDHARLLEPWYKVLRDARERLLVHGPSPELEAVKAVYRSGIGRFGSSHRTIENDPLFQPYWRHAIIAQARCNLLRRIAKLAQSPVAVEVDCLTFLTNTADPESFAKRIGLPIGTKIGEFKLKYKISGKAGRACLAEESLGDTFAAIRRAAA